jgi:alpha-L-fucosidase
MYREGTPQYDHHLKTYGGPAKFGYKDFIPRFTGEKFDPEAWADLFRRAGAGFAGPVGEHHDGFCMWDTTYSDWNAAKMGPKRDVVAELEKAIRNQGLKFMVALHHAENWWFYPHWRKDYDTSDPRFAGLYGESHNLDGNVGQGFFDQEPPSQAFLERWKAKTLEVIERFQPDLLWFDFGLGNIQENYRLAMLADYYNQAETWGREVEVTYKWHNLAPGAGVVDLELGRFDALMYHDWITDTTVDSGEAWGYIQEAGYKSLKTLVHYLVDNVSKNGYLLLNVGPKANGEIPVEAQELLVGIGKWLQINGEAIYGTTPWLTYGEGPTQMHKAGYFMEDQEVQYTSEDIRFTVKDNLLYAVLLGWPTERVNIQSLKQLYPTEIKSVHMLGVEADLSWQWTPLGLQIWLPAQKPCENAYVIRIERKHPFYE